MDLPVKWEATGSDEIFFEIKIGGLRGGHSGGDIHRHRGNAHKILARALDEIQRAVPIRLAALKGGTARNAIPRDAEAVFACPKGSSALCREIAISFKKTLRTEFGSIEHGLFLTLTESQVCPEKYIRLDDTKKCIQFVMAMPNGVKEFSAAVDGAVETSNNIGIINLLDDGFHIIASPRSSVASRLEELARHVEAITMLAGATSKRSTMSLPWMPNMDSPLLKKCVDTYESLYKQKPKIEVIHGGLECGIISERCGGMDSISLGPTIENPHSPDERLFIPSIPRTWDFLTSLLRTI
jgi:dipeptidase D